MRLTTLMEILEQEIGASPSARAKLDLLVAERGQKDTAARKRASATAASKDPRSVRARSAGRAG